MAKTRYASHVVLFPSAPNVIPCQTGYGPFSYDQPYVTPHTSSITFSPPTHYSKASDTPATIVKEATGATFSPVSEYSRISESGHPDAPRISTEQVNLGADSDPLQRPRSSPSAFQPNQPSNDPVQIPWTMNPLGISTPPMHQHYFQGSTYPPLRNRSPRLSEPAMEFTADLTAPQPRRMYAPIAPHPIGSQRTSVPKRPREDDESPEQSKRRKRSDSNSTMSMELGEEDKLLIQLKDEESMPWKDIAARFQSDLGKTYQIPALQMRLKRLRERMRVWTETDVRALRMAHEYWMQSKFDIISQKVNTFPFVKLPRI